MKLIDIDRLMAATCFWTKKKTTFITISLSAVN